ncbi:MAG: hypothetical protein ACTHMI_01300 [Mucilaginibacter sp.]|uniref:hypothetical protein n=1 Tax=Mucilaginibacter sp. L3T2-6 TaxID=3062491 RepID=UPI00267572A9|nr:hypothetical protein [Mucilaginibacter sp. L3T2-6]MDO3644175.1 hypothetical protein [Mucilaginibacter sp. L3T2-6]MDV6216544.1 hypothetical protein [Mucilaginibacter sp. L3T2-6]
MNSYYTIEEKYLKAVDRAVYGKAQKALQLFNEIISNDPLHAKAHHQLGKIYYYEMEDYQTAGYHFKTCMELEPSYPGNYGHYLHLAVFLNMEKLVKQIAGKALTVPGVDVSDIHDQLGLSAEKNKRWLDALAFYNEALEEAVNKKDREKIEESIERVTAKIKRAGK